MLNQLQVFENELFKVSAKNENGEILFDVEQVAKCLGFTEIKNGVEYVRWNRVNSYLPRVSPKVAKGDLIPESLVYKLAFKASNDVAEKFQDWLAIEVIPSIRQTGTYLKPNNTKLLLETALKHEEEIEEIKTDVSMLKNSMRIDGAEEFQIRERANRKVIQSLGGKDAPAYKELNRRVFSKFWNEFKRHFMIPRYGDLPKSRFQEGLEFIEEWQPDTSTRIEIANLNKQMTIKEVS